jgi:predicted nucleic acid-binding protein
MTRFVLDASVALTWFFEDEFTPYADEVAILMLQNQAIAPIIWPLEIANAMLTAVRRGRFPESRVPSMMYALRRLPIKVELDVSPMELAQAAATLGLPHRLSAYDASYLELALRRGVPLATQDRQLRDAAVAAGVQVFQP